MVLPFQKPHLPFGFICFFPYALISIPIWFQANRKKQAREGMYLFMTSSISFGCPTHDNFRLYWLSTVPSRSHQAQFHKPSCSLKRTHRSSALSPSFYTHIHTANPMSLSHRFAALHDRFICNIFLIMVLLAYVTVYWFASERVMMRICWYVSCLSIPVYIFGTSEVGKT